MEPFLKKTAEFLVEKYGEDLSRVCVILPNRRGGMFLRKFLAGALERPAWSPAVFSIEDFIGEISGLREVDQTVLLFELYEVHHGLEGAQAQSFEEFLRWAPQLLSDFNEIDRYMTDAEQLFGTLTEARAISLWNLENKPLTEFETKYLHFYQSLAGYHREFTNRLKSRRMAYQGMNFREAADRIGSLRDRLPYHHYVLAGFNALTRAEEQIFSALHEEGLAVFRWDADRYYLENREQEAGDFLREWFRKWPVQAVDNITDDLLNSEKKIRVVGVPDPVGQVKYCGALLRELAKKGEADEQTAIVLLDEGLLLPLLNSIPEEIASLNITAGFPLRQTPLASFFEDIFQLHANRDRFAGQAGGGAVTYYFRDVLRILLHPYLRNMAEIMTGRNLFALQDATDRIRTGGKVFLRMTDITHDRADLFSSGLSFLEIVFRPWTSPSAAAGSLVELVRELQRCLSDNHPGRAGKEPEEGNRPGGVDLEYLFEFARIFIALGQRVADFRHELTFRAFQQLYNQVMASSSIPFYGEPLKGIQVMGMLETRSLDFRNLVLVSCNEDLLPSGKIAPSFIPFDLKRSFRLPTYRHKDSVYAYHFYRLLQRAENIWLLYNTEPDQLGGGEKSRFIRQISGELAAYNPRITIQEMMLATPPGTDNAERIIEIPKTGTVAERMLELARSGFSATSLNAYRNCTLKFYYAEVAGIREPEEIPDTVDAAVLGSVVHDALCRLFKPTAGSILTVQMLELLLAKVDDAVVQAFKKKFKGADLRFGKNLLFKRVAGIMVMRFIRSECERIPALASAGRTSSVSMLEQYLETELTILVGGVSRSVKVKGILDRVDFEDGSWKIIDYKTGTVDSRNVKIRDWDDLPANPDLNIGFQLLLYGFLMGRCRKSGQPSSAGILSLRKLNSGFLPVLTPSEGDAEPTAAIDTWKLNEFQRILEDLLAGLYDPGVPFRQTSDRKVCEYCPYINLCGR